MISIEHSSLGLLEELDCHPVIRELYSDWLKKPVKLIGFIESNRFRPRKVFWLILPSAAPSVVARMHSSDVRSKESSKRGSLAPEIVSRVESCFASRGDSCERTSHSCG
jgi:hypothetical protein